MKVSVQKAGEQLAVTIPPEVAMESRLEPGTVLDLSVQGGQIVLKRAHRATLEELVRRITPETLHGDVDFGPAVGRELL
ncbi:MAG: AbrB/MazE/SpoVT family DNA-binding domain-containing protein [Acidobacteriota bacterium]